MKSLHHSIRQRGIALISVLALLTLLALLVLSILFTSRVERQSSSSFASSIEARTLADSSVNLCIGQIRDATLPYVDQTNEDDGTTSRQARAWISQPGLLRTFRGDRQPDTNYRLYSWSKMRVDGDFDPYSLDNQVPSTWKSDPALYVDLNQPVPNSDPDKADDPTEDFYPILYPPELIRKEGNTEIAGYRVPAESTAVPGATGTETITPVPMPVQWLYVLKNGDIVEAESITAGKVRVGGATVDNPIVGRIAFWGDDESAKVNVNTAAGGRGWWVPWVETAKENKNTNGNPYGMGFSQPVRNEYQRYPGHPARTSLRAIFPEIKVEEAYVIAPRIVNGGSKGGMTMGAQSQVIRPDADRFYASLGELIYNATMRVYGEDFSSDSWRAVQGDLFSLKSGLWEAMVEHRKSFLTAFSRAPELTLFGTPRVAVWPISTTKNPTGTSPSLNYFRSPVDHLIAFCSTIRNGTTEYPFYFTRATGGNEANSALKPDADINRARNNVLYRYLQRLTGEPIPGMGSVTFADASRYGPLGRDQILTEIFDYIRATNISEMTVMPPNNRQVTRYSLINTVMPTRYTTENGDTRGFGRMFAVRQVGFQFICTADPDTPDSNYPKPGSGNPALPAGKKANLSLETKLVAGQRRIQALLLVELFSPSAGPKMFYTGGGGPLKPAIRVKGLDGLEVETNGVATPLGFPSYDNSAPGSQAGARVDSASWSPTYGNSGGAACYAWLFARGNSKAVHDVRTTGDLVYDNKAGAYNSPYQYVSVPITIQVPPTGMMKLKGGKITVEIRDMGITSGASDFLLNSVDINLDDVEIPVPTLNASNAFWAFHAKGIFGDSNPAGRMKDAGPVTDGNLIQAGDTVITYILPHGDYRSLYLPDSPLNTFVPVPTTDATNAMRHVLSNDKSAVVGQLSGTSLSESPVTWAERWAPAMLPKAAYGARLGPMNAPWTYYDWDTGSPLTSTDGPLINKPDEGGWSSTATINSYVREYLAYNTVAADLYYQSANRQIPSPVMFGSLPTGLVDGKPWQTLLFRPDPGGHPGAKDPPDHLLLDLFWMPVVEPYAISEPFSTAGKVNMNYQMIPFTYIERASGIHAVLADERFYAIPETDWPDGYGKLWKFSSSQKGEFDHGIDVDETLTPFRERFKAKSSVHSIKDRVFLTPSEITEHYIVAEGETYDSMPAFWNQHRLTGENIRERIYAEIYPRLTTRSNVFNIHYRVQTLRKPPKGDPTIWEEAAGGITSELRGNTVIERYIDMNRKNGIPDYAQPPTTSGDEASAESLYRFRVLSSQEFNP